MNFVILRVDARLIVSLKGSIQFYSNVYALPLADPNIEPIKCMRVVDLDFVSDSQQTIVCIIWEAEI